MEDKNNHIDDFAKKGIEGMNFEFKDAYWDEMEALLDNKSKSKRGIIFWWVSGIASILVLSLGVYFWNGYQSSEGQSIVLNDNQHEQVDFKQKDSELEKATSSPTDLNSFESLSNENSMHEDPVGPNSDEPYNNSSDKNNYAIDNNDKSNSVSSFSPNSKVVSTSFVDKTLDETIELNNDLSITEKSNNYEYVQPIEVRIASVIETDEVIFSPIEANGSSKQKSIHTNVEMVGGLGYGMNTTKNMNSIGGMNGSLGLQFNLEYRRFAFQTGLSFGANGINGFNYKETKRIYGFSSQEVVNEINYNAMLSASVPVYLGYSGLKHSFSAGVKLNFLLNANGRVDTWNDEINSTNTWGYSNALNNSWITGGVNYFYKLNRRFSVGMMVDFDLTNRGEYSANGVQNDFRMWNAFVGIKYRLN